MKGNIGAVKGVVMPACSIQTSPYAARITKESPTRYASPSRGPKLCFSRLRAVRAASERIVAQDLSDRGGDTAARSRGRAEVLEAGHLEDRTARQRARPKLASRPAEAKLIAVVRVLEHEAVAASARIAVDGRR